MPPRFKGDELERGARSIPSLSSAVALRSRFAFLRSILDPLSVSHSDTSNDEGVKGDGETVLEGYRIGSFWHQAPRRKSVFKGASGRGVRADWAYRPVSVCSSTGERPPTTGAARSDVGRGRENDCRVFNTDPSMRGGRRTRQRIGATGRPGGARRRRT